MTPAQLEHMLHIGERIAVPAEPWTITETAVEPGRAQYWETIFALSNGTLGLRGTYDEHDPDIDKHSYPGMFVNGVYEYKPYHYEWKSPGFPDHGHAMVNLVDWRASRLTVDGEAFTSSSSKIVEYCRQLDMRRGVVIRTLVWTTSSGKRIRIESTRLVSMVRHHSAAIRYEVTPLDEDCAVTIEGLLTPTVPSQVLPGETTEVVEQARDGDLTQLHVKTKTASFHIGVAVIHSVCRAMDESGQPAPAAATAAATPPGRGSQPGDNCAVGSGRTLTFDKHACFFKDTEAGSVVADAVAQVQRDAADGFETLFAEQEVFWAEYWDKADVEIDGNERDQQAVRFAIFQTRQSCATDGFTSIGANGLTGDKYCGHVFWDTEMYAAPHLLYTQPELVRPLLMYRYHLLDRARERARQMGHVGALYSWNSISGEECGVVYEAATAEYHLLSAIATCIDRYVRNTGDEDFLFEYGAEILFETSRFFADLGKFIPARGGKFCLNVVCGPDEYGCGVNNNCYTNMLAQWHFRFACHVYDRMQAERPDLLAALAQRVGTTPGERATWEEAADKMLILWNDELGIHEQDDSFLYLDPVDMSTIPQNHDIREDMHPLNLWRMQVAKQADVVLLMFVLGNRFTPEQKKRNYEFYEPKTCHGSSLSACIHSIAASEIGRTDEAYAYFEHSALLDIADFKNNTAGGAHSACLGGTWMAVVNGFAGMRDYEEGLLLNPALPDAWEAVRFKLNYQGRVLGVTITHDGVDCRLLSGEALTLTVGGERIMLNSRLRTHGNASLQEGNAEC